MTSRRTRTRTIGRPRVVSRRETPVGLQPAKDPGRDALALRLTRRDKRQIGYALYRSYVLLAKSRIEPISEHIHDQVPLRQPTPLQRMTIEHHIPNLAAIAAVDPTTIRYERIFAAHSPWPAGIRARSPDPQR
jgi:hypothetical protein